MLTNFDRLFGMEGDALTPLVPSDLVPPPLGQQEPTGELIEFTFPESEADGETLVVRIAR